MKDLAEMERILVCPACKQPVKLVDQRFWCTGPECRRSYPIDEDGTPHMMVTEATVEDRPAPGSNEPAA
jgi:uncharacterized protein YbaR (Trm112 family)